ncbi:MAG: ABC transporter permease, partial [Clostridia bacterium]|nr:ABC transporter permease [Clostridia bacterium]
ICTEDKDTIVSTLLEQNYKAYDTYQKDQEDFNEERKDVVLSTTILGLVMLGISLIEMFLMSRSSFLSRIKEVGMLRAIGAKKFDIYKMFMGEIIAITTLTSLPAMLLMYYGESYLVKSVKTFEDVFYLPVPYLILTILVVYVFNLLIGLLPVWNTMRKRPAAILARKDVD